MRAGPVHRGLQLGTTALTSQAAPAPAIVVVRQPDQLRAGSVVWVYFRRWRAGTVRRIIRRDPGHAHHGAPRGDVAVVQIDELRASNLTVRRPVAELVLATDAEPGPHLDRKAAQAFAREWWIELARSL